MIDLLRNLKLRSHLLSVAGVSLFVLTGLSTTAPVRAAVPPSVSAPCAWAGESDQRDVNIGAPDMDAYYVADNLPVMAGERVLLQGDYPFARYFSFHVYSDRTQLALATIYDQQIDPEPHSGNPFRAPARSGAGDAYAVQIVFAPRPQHPTRNTMYVDPKQLGPTAMLIYRIYVPTDPTSPDGSVSYPSVTIQNSHGAVTEPGCATVTPRGGSAVYALFADSNYPPFLPAQNVAGASRIPVWARSFGSKLGNKQNAYLWTTISRQYGSVVVIHARVATFPNSRAGQPVYGSHQLRYWSFCTYDQQGEAGYGCAADYAAVVRHGYVTYVVSDPGSRPSNAVAGNGVTWLPWGSDQYSAQVMERNMLPSPGFAHAIQRVTKAGPTSDPRRVLGAYYPRAVYCTTALFERGGWRACFRSAGLPTN